MTNSDDVTQALTWFLSQQSDVLSVVGSEKGVPYVFQGGKPFVEIEGTSSACILVRQVGGWTSPNLYNTLRFPRLRIDVWSDPPRDESGHVTRETEARTAIYAIDNVLDTYLHRPDGEAVQWRDVVSVTCVRLTEMSIVERREGDKVLVGSAMFAASVIYPPA